MSGPDLSGQLFIPTRDRPTKITVRCTILGASTRDLRQKSTSLPITQLFLTIGQTGAAVSGEVLEDIQYRDAGPQSGGVADHHQREILEPAQFGVTGPCG